MKKMILALFICALSTNLFAATLVRQFTGDNMAFAKVSPSSTTASTLATYSTGRGELTCINGDASNTVWVGTSTNVSAGGSFSFPIFAKQSITLDNNSSLFGIADTGISSVNVYCITEN